MKYKLTKELLIVYNKKKSEHKFIIDWSAKAGCTIINKIFFDYMDILEESLKYDPWIHNSRGRYYRKYGVVTPQKILSNEYIKIKFVRNPYSRAISSYINAMCTFIITDNISFDTFLINIKKNKINNNIHHDFQKLEIENNNKNIFGHIIKIENLEEEINKINKLYNIELKSTFSSHHHVKKNNNNIFNDELPYLKYDKIKNNIPSYKHFYNEEIKKLVYDIYRDDILTYNYTFEEFLLTN